MKEETYDDNEASWKSLSIDEQRSYKRRRKEVSRFIFEQTNRFIHNFHTSFGYGKHETSTGRLGFT
jgi:hypothetical protein